MKRFIRAVCLVTALFALTVSGMNAQTTSDGLRYERNHEGGVTITKYTGNAATLTIPAALDGIPVTTIEFAAFSGCAGLTGVTIPNSVIEFAVFSGCAGLRSVTIPDSVTHIGA